MRLQPTIVENFIKDTLHVFILTVILVCPFSGCNFEIKVMKSTLTTTASLRSHAITSPSSSSSSSSSLSSSAAAAAAALYANSDYQSADDANFGYEEITTITASATSAAAQLSHAEYAAIYPHTSDTFNDSNEIDSMDYVMTKHIASHGQPMPFLNKTQDLSSLSLLSSNQTTTTTTIATPLKLNVDSSSSSSSSSSSFKQRTNPTSQHHSHSQHHHGSGRGIGSNATFQHIGSQRIALQLSTTTTTTTTSPSATATIATNDNSGSGSGNSSNSATGSSKFHTRTSAKKVESKYILPKPQKTDAPMLNYIFDTFSSANKHHHHDQRYGPHFEDVQRVGQPTNLTVQAGSSIHLNCRISLLQDKTVSWVRRNALFEDALDLLTVGLHTYTGDKRYKMEFQYPNNWRLKITNVKKDDEALYECQISTHPPRVIQINLHVNAPKVMIVDEVGDPLQEKYYEIDSTLQLSCVVRNVAMATSVVYWKHAEDVLNYDVTRGGVSVKTELMDDGANSTLFIAKINKADSGNYTCSISDFQNFSIVVHILNGESFAELHHGGAAHVAFHNNNKTLVINLIIFILLLLLPAYIHR